MRHYYGQSFRSSLVLLLWILLSCSPARAGELVLFTSRTAWAAASNGLSIVSFDGFASPGGFIAFDTPSGLTASGVTFVGASPSNPTLPFYLRIVDPAYFPPFYDWGSGAVLHGPPIPQGPQGEGGPGSHITVSLPGGMTSVGTDIMSFLQYASPFDIVVRTASRSAVYTVNSFSYPARAFVGFTSQEPIISVEFYATAGFPVLDSCGFGHAELPPSVEAEPASPQIPIPCRGSKCNVPVRCNLPQDPGTQCANRITLFVHASSLRLNDSPSLRARKRIRFAFGIANIPPGQIANVRLQLTKKGNGIVEKKKRKRLKGVIEIRSAAGFAISSTPVRIRLR